MLCFDTEGEADTEDSDTVLDDSVLQSLRTYSQHPALKKAALMVIAHSMTSVQISHLRETFQQIDKSNHGTITLEELQDALKEEPDLDRYVRYMTTVFA